MSHVFISYKSEDKPYLLELKQVLDQAGIELWYDDSIPGGEDWSREIDGALDEAFAVVMILTSKSVTSHYVTYEWSRAMGQGIEIIPLLFQKTVPRRIHPRLSSIEYISCFPAINQLRVIDRLQELSTKSKRSIFVDRMIGKILLPFRILLATLALTFSHETKYSVQASSEVIDFLLCQTWHELHIIRNEKFEQFWITSSHSFSRKQSVQFENINHYLDDLSSSLDWIQMIPAQRKYGPTINGDPILTTRNSFGRNIDKVPELQNEFDTFLKAQLTVSELPVYTEFVRETKRIMDLDPKFDYSTVFDTYNFFESVIDRLLVQMDEKMFSRSDTKQLIGDLLRATLKYWTKGN